MRNSIQLIGNLGADPVVHQTRTGKKVSKVNLATNRTYTNAKGERVKETQWHRIVGWGKTADYMEKYLAKGSLVGVLGKLKYNQVKSDDGTSRSYTEIVVSEVRNFSWKELPF